MNFITDDLPLMSCVSMPDGTKPEQAAVFLHGYGANGRDLFDISTYLRRVFPNAAFYFPDAPDSIGFGGYQWFPLDGYDPAMLVQPQRGEAYLKSLMPLAESVRPTVERYLDAVRKHAGVSSGKTALCGFSQGGLSAVLTALKYREKLAAAVGLSAVAVTFDETVLSPADIVSRPPVTLIHGDADDVVPPAVFERNAEALRQAGLAVDTHVVAGLTHGIDATALRYLCDALQRGFAD